MYPTIKEYVLNECIGPDQAMLVNRLIARGHEMDWHVPSRYDDSVDALNWFAIRPQFVNDAIDEDLVVLECKDLDVAWVARMHGNSLWEQAEWVDFIRRIRPEYSDTPTE